MRLTIKQENFIKNLIDGDSQRVAFRKAYPASIKWKDSAVDSQASRTLKIPKVYTRYRELLGKIEKEHREKNLWNRERSVKYLIWVLEKSRTDITDNGIKHANSNAFLNAIKELNEVEGIGVKRELEAKKLTMEVDQGNSIEDQLQDYFKLLRETILNE